MRFLERGGRIAAIDDAPAPAAVNRSLGLATRWPPVDQVELDALAAAELIDYRAEGDVNGPVNGGQFAAHSPPPKATARSVTPWCESIIAR